MSSKKRSMRKKIISLEEKINFLLNKIPAISRINFDGIQNDNSKIEALDRIYDSLIKNISFDKKNFRKKMRAVREQQSKEDIIIKSKIISERLFKTDEYKNSESIFCYLSFSSEINTDKIIQNSIFEGKTVAVPIIIDGKMYCAKIDNFTSYIINKYGIKEPKNIFLIEKKDISLCIVPALSYNYLGFRVGYGGGYYDKFLSDYTGISIGLIFKELISTDIIPESFDIPVNFIISN